MLCSSRPAFFNTAAVPGIGPSSMRTGSVPTTAWARMRARGLMPSCFAFSSDMSSTAAAPSEIWLELPAVIECAGSNAGWSAEVDS